MVTRRFFGWFADLAWRPISVETDARAHVFAGWQAVIVTGQPPCSNAKTGADRCHHREVIRDLFHKGLTGSCVRLLLTIAFLARRRRIPVSFTTLRAARSPNCLFRNNRGKPQPAWSTGNEEGCEAAYSHHVYPRPSGSYQSSWAHSAFATAEVAMLRTGLTSENRTAHGSVRLCTSDPAACSTGTASRPAFCRCSRGAVLRSQARAVSAPPAVENTRLRRLLADHPAGHTIRVARVAPGLRAVEGLATTRLGELPVDRGRLGNVRLYALRNPRGLHRDRISRPLVRLPHLDGARLPHSLAVSSPYTPAYPDGGGQVGELLKSIRPPRWRPTSPVTGAYGAPPAEPVSL
jgi:hypothetical protein